MSGGKGKLKGAADGVPFKKNDPRINRKGRPLKLPDLDELLKDVLGEQVQGKEALKAVLIALRKKALSGDVRACELLLDRAYGKLRNIQDLTVDFKQMSEHDLDAIASRLLTNTKKDEK